MQKRDKLTDHANSRTALLVVSFILFIFHLGCGKKQPKAASNEPKSKVSTNSTETVETLQAPSRILLKNPLDRGLAADDAEADGWNSELLSQVASDNLETLGNYLTKVDSSEIAWIEKDCRASGFVPTDLRSRYSDSNFQVVESENSDSAPTMLPLEQVVAEFRRDWHGYRDLHFKFKVFHISGADQKITTTQYAHFSGEESTGKAKEQNSTWTAIWRKDEHVLRLLSIRVTDFSQAIVQHSTFVDDTRGLLSDQPRFSIASRYDMNHWRRTLEARHGVYNFSHHGIAVGDVNGDDLPDVYVCETGGLPNHLYLQTETGGVREASSAAQVDYLDNTRSALFVDLDNDHDQDLAIAFAQGMVLLENDGQGKFQERARFNGIRAPFSLAASDYDNDGRLDLFVCVYYGASDDASELPEPIPYFDAKNGGNNYLLKSLGNWEFRDATDETGLQSHNSRYTFAAAWDDFDLDGDQDLYVVNDFGPNQLFRNDNSRFTQIGAASGLIDGAFGMSAAFGDFDRDGLDDIYVSNMFSAAGNRVTFQPQFKPSTDERIKKRFQHLARGNSLFRNIQGKRFEDVSVAARVTMGRWSWGSLFADINNDGWEDLLVGNGFITGEQPDDL